MKLASAITGTDYTKNWKVLALIAGLILSTALTSCSPAPTASPDATQQGDAMKDKSGAMKGDAMKGDAKDKGDAMKGGATPSPSTKP